MVPYSNGLICITASFIQFYIYSLSGFPDISVHKESACNAGDPSLVPRSGRSPGEGKGYPLQYSGLENSMDCIVHGVAKGPSRLSDFHFHFHTLWTVIFTFICEQCPYNEKSLTLKCCFIKDEKNCNYNIDVEVKSYIWHCFLQFCKCSSGLDLSKKMC